MTTSLCWSHNTSFAGWSHNHKHRLFLLAPLFMNTESFLLRNPVNLITTTLVAVSLWVRMRPQTSKLMIKMSSLLTVVNHNWRTLRLWIQYVTRVISDVHKLHLARRKSRNYVLKINSVLWSRSRKEPELMAGAGAGAGMSKFRLRLRVGLSSTGKWK